MSRGKPGRKGPQDITLLDSCWYTFGCAGVIAMAFVAATATVAKLMYRTRRITRNNNP